MSEIADFLKNNPVAVIVTGVVGFLAGIATLAMFFRKGTSDPHQPKYVKCARCSGKGQYGGSRIEGPRGSVEFSPPHTCDVCGGKGVVQL